MGAWAASAVTGQNHTGTVAQLTRSSPSRGTLTSSPAAPLGSLHGALRPDGSPAGPFGLVPTEVTLEDAQHSARLATLAMLASLKTALGDLDRVTAWLTISGHVNAEPGYRDTTAVVNPASELIIDLYGVDAGQHARTAIEAPALPLNLPVVIAAEVEIANPEHG
jgi:enamine deaminase RidA (YjgF/YER057c/UK114 family)